MTTDVDPAEVAKKIVAIEAEVHRRGWDKSPELHLLYPNATGLASWSTLQEWPSGHPGVMVAGLARKLEAGADDPMIRYMIRHMQQKAPDCCAAVFIVESYINGAGLPGSMSAEEMQEYESGGGLPLADRVGSHEARTVGGV